MKRPPDYITVEIPGVGSAYLYRESAYSHCVADTSCTLLRTGVGISEQRVEIEGRFIFFMCTLRHIHEIRMEHSSN